MPAQSLTLVLPPHQSGCQTGYWPDQSGAFASWEWSTHVLTYGSVRVSTLARLRGQSVQSFSRASRATCSDSMDSGSSSDTPSTCSTRANCW